MPGTPGPDLSSTVRVSDVRVLGRGEERMEVGIQVAKVVSLLPERKLTEVG